MLLTKHEGVTFQNQSVYISGQAFVRCRFVSCTLVLRESPYYLEGCGFDKCNWHVDRLLMWGHPESTQEIKSLITLIESTQARPQPGAGSEAGGAPETGPMVNIPNFTAEGTT